MTVGKVPPQKLRTKITQDAIVQELLEFNSHFDLREKLTCYFY